MREIIGNTTATPMPRSDWSQTDASKADYIKNKPNIPTKPSELANDSNFVTLSDVPDEIYVGNGDMPEGATIQILTDGSDAEQELKDELKEYIDGELAVELAKRSQLKPEFANSVDELDEKGDISKLYVLPDGMIYAYMKTTGVGGDAYTNRLLSAEMGSDQATGWIEGGGYTKNARISGSSGSVTVNYTQVAGMCLSGYIRAEVGDEIRIKNFYSPNGVAGYVISYDSSKARIANKQWGIAEAASGLEWGAGVGAADWYTVEGVKKPEGITTFKLTEANFGTNVAFIRISGCITEDTIITVNEEIVEGGTSAIVEKWASTGHAFVPADYDNEIANLKLVTNTHTQEINDVRDRLAKVENGISNLTDEEKLDLIKNWDTPIYDANIPVFELSEEKPSMTNATMTPDALYAMYDALMAKYPHYITKTDLGLCSDGVNHVYRYDFKDPEQRHYHDRRSETKAKAIIMSGVHLEWAGMFGLYYALEEITENPALRDLRRNVHLIVVPCASPFTTIWSNWDVSEGQKNANGVEVHQNFEVGFLYPDHPDYEPPGTTHHGGTEPLSEVETQYIDNILKENTDAAFFLTCHNMNFDEFDGVTFIWGSVGTKYMCNMAYRLIDKMSQAWMDKYRDELIDGIADYRTANLEAWDERLGWSQISINNGTETRQATKYGIQAANVEICERFWVHGTKANQEPLHSSFTMSRGAEVYVNFLLTAFGVYDPKDKALYN